MKKTAFLFPGQGSQSVGMGQDIYHEYEVVRELFDMAEEITKTNLSKICFKGPMEELTKTANLQPAITAVNLAVLEAIEKEGVSWDITAGHSLGEYSSIKAAGVVAPEDIFRLVHKRGELMHRESEKHKGAMCAVIGLSVDTVDQLVAKARKKMPKGALSVANYNAETQIVASGDQDSIKLLTAMAKEAGGRALPLKVSGAWHSPLIKGAENEFRDFIDAFEFQQPKKEIIFNVSADYESMPETIRENLAKQLCSPVRWYETINRMLEADIEIFVEVGPGKVLSGLVRKIVPKDYQYKIYNVNDMKTLELFFKDVI